MHVGNDLIDLNQSGFEGKWKNPRFLRRAFTEKEQNEILGSTNRDLSLASAWAAKETAFKALVKADSSICFYPTAFEFDSSLNRVVHAAQTAIVKFDSTKDYLHCVGASHEQMLNLIQSKIIRSPDARSALQTLLASHSDLIDPVVRRKESSGRLDPPRIYSCGQPALNYDLSLSHDGDWSAAILLRLDETILTKFTTK